MFKKLMTVCRNMFRSKPFAERILTRLNKDNWFDLGDLGMQQLVIENLESEKICIPGMSPLETVSIDFTLTGCTANFTYTFDNNSTVAENMRELREFLHTQASRASIPPGVIQD